MNKYTKLNNGNIRITLQVALSRQSGRTRIFDAEENHADAGALVAFAKARHWQKLIDSGRYSSTNDLGKSLGVDYSYVARIMRLNLVSPRIIRLFFTGKAPSNLSVKALLRPLPASWEEQEAMFGIKVK